MVHRLDFDWGLHRLAAAADSGGSGDYKQLNSHLVPQFSRTDT